MKKNRNFWLHLLNIAVGGAFAAILGVRGITPSDWGFWLLLGMFLGYGILKDMMGFEEGIEMIKRIRGEVR